MRLEIRFVEACTVREVDHETAFASGIENAGELINLRLRQRGIDLELRDDAIGASVHVHVNRLAALARIGRGADADGIAPENRNLLAVAGVSQIVGAGLSPQEY